MSQYRDDRDAARHRIEALEAKLAERERELEAKGLAISARDEEIARLRRDLALPFAPGRPKKLAHAAWAARMVGVAVGVAGVAMGLGVWAIRAPRSTMVEASPREAPAAEAPTLADPARVAANPGHADDMPGVEEARPPDERALRALLEAKLNAGNATTDELRMLKAICSHQGDRACRDRVAKLLPRPRPPVF